MTVGYVRDKTITSPLSQLQKDSHVMPQYSKDLYSLLVYLNEKTCNGRIWNFYQNLH